MSIKKRVLLGTLGIGALLTAFSCNQTDGVGDPCVPESELDPTKNGFAIDEVSVEARSVQCASRLCLVNHFQGRVSCPLGQTAGDGTCLVPGTTEPVTVDVKAWDLDRPADTAVYCSCRCDGPDANARYCDCPDGFSCQPLIDDYGMGQQGLVGSYCVRDGTVYSPTQAGGPTCADMPDDPACAP